jgi:hypothetical protein
MVLWHSHTLRADLSDPSHEWHGRLFRAALLGPALRSLLEMVLCCYCCGQHVIDSTKTAAVEAVRELIPDGADHVFDFVGLTSVAEKN